MGSLTQIDDATLAAQVRAESAQYEAYEKPTDQRWGHSVGRAEFSVTEIGIETAKALAEYSGWVIDLHKVTSVSNEIVTILAARKAPSLRLCAAEGGLSEQQRTMLLTPPKEPNAELVEYLQGQTGRFFPDEAYVIKKALLEKGWSPEDVDAAFWATFDLC